MTAKLASAIKRLKEALPEGVTLDEDRATSDIKAAIGPYNSAVFNDLISDNQMTARESLKALKPILNNLTKLNERLHAKRPKGWRNWLRIAEVIYKGRSRS